MDFPKLHRWDVTPKEAVAIQREFADRLQLDKSLRRWELIAGADVSYNRFSDKIYACVLVWRAADGVVVERHAVARRMTFPYVPGLLSFREAPALLDAFARLRTEPDVVILDGQGIAHPRRMGFASHVGLWLPWPTVGCAKSLLVGDFEPPAEEAASSSPLVVKGEVRGAVLRSRSRVKPLFVSPGNRIDLESSVKVVLGCIRKYRLPEPTRLADQLANECRRMGKV